MKKLPNIHPRKRLSKFLAWVVLLIASNTLADEPASDAPSSLSPKAGALPTLRVEGNRFVDPQGNPIVLRGVALSDPLHLSENDQWNRAYFEAIRSWNANLVRIPIHPEWWRNAGMDQYFEWLDDGVRWAGELGMYVIIDWHTIGNPQTHVPFRPMYRTTREETFYFWNQTATRYQNNPTVAFFELFNEPTNIEGKLGRLSWDYHKRYMEDLIYMIHNIDSSKIALVAGFQWAYDLRTVAEAPIEADNVAYVTHPYPQKRPEPWEEHWEEDWGFLAERYPIVATEFGFMNADGPGAHVPVIADEAYGERIIQFFEERHISWTPWVFDAEWPPQLISDWDYTPTAQGRVFRDAMRRLNP